MGVVVCKASVLNWLGVSICLLYICIVLDLAVGVVVCKASVLNWLGVSICLLYICIVLDLAVGVVVCKASIFNWLCTGIQGIYAQLTGGSRSTSGCIGMQGICLDWLVGSICLLYICIVLDLAVVVAVCKASVLDWLGVHLPSIFMYCTRSSSRCSGMQGIYAWLTGGPSAFYIYALY